MTHRAAQEIDPEVYRAYHRRRDEERRRQREELRTSVLARTRAAIRRVAPLYPAVQGVRPDLLGTARGFGDQSTESGLEVVAAEGSETLAELRDAVLPRLISGELQVEDAGRTFTRSGA